LDAWELSELSWLVTKWSRKNSLVGDIEFFGVDEGIRGREGTETVGFGVEMEVLLLLVGAAAALSFSLSVSAMGLWVLGSMPLCLSFFLRQEFHRFLISLSVLPGNCAAI